MRHNARHAHRHSHSSEALRRLTIRRILLALVLGLAAWWGVGWWLIPRAALALRFPDLGSIQLPGSFYSPAVFQVALDTQDLFHVCRPNYPVAGSITVERFDLRKGELLKSEGFAATEYRRHHRMTQEGTWLLLNGVMAVSSDTPGKFEHLRDYPEWEQSVRFRYASYGPLDEVREYFPDVVRWMNRPSVGVWDDAGDRFLWSAPAYDTRRGGLNWTDILTNERGRFVVVIQSGEKQHDIAVLELPIARISPWWPRSAGLLTTALVLFARRRRRGLSAA